MGNFPEECFFRVVHISFLLHLLKVRRGAQGENRDQVLDESQLNLAMYKVEETSLHCTSGYQWPGGISLSSYHPITAPFLPGH